jgi:hypothetical protein
MIELDELKRRIETCHATIHEQRAEIDRLHACADELLSDLQRIDETSCLSDGDSVSVSVALWAGDWAKRMKDAGFVTANTPNQEHRQSPEVGCSALPRLNIRCEYSDGVVHGSTYLNVVRVEKEDDGSLTAVTDHCPNAVHDGRQKKTP